jgi:hypothetical protein
MLQAHCVDLSSGKPMKVLLEEADFDLVRLSPPLSSVKYFVKDDVDDRVEVDDDKEDQSHVNKANEKQTGEQGNKAAAANQGSVQVLSAFK